MRRGRGHALEFHRTLAAADMVSDPDDLGRPRAGADVAARLDLLGQLISGATAVPGPVLAAVVHGELLSLDAFPTANGIIARAASRLVCTSTGLDPHNLGVPEVTWLKRIKDYRAYAQGFAAGTPEGLGNWIVLCCEALEAGAAEAKSIADSTQ